MNRIFALFTTLFVLHCISCEKVDESGNSKVWQGTDESFESNFSFQPSLVDDSVILTRSGSQESYSGFVEINKSGIITKQNYSEGLLNGKSIKKSADGSWVEANYENGKLNGSMKLYDRSGVLRSTLIYSKGKLQPNGMQ